MGNLAGGSRQRLFGILSRYAIVFYALACASSGPSSGEPNPQRVDAPKMVARGAAPQLRIPSNSSSRSPVSVTIEVMIDSTGQPDMATFKVTGFGASENRDALATWIQQAIFQPAQRSGQPVPGLFSTKLQASVRRIR